MESATSPARWLNWMTNLCPGRVPEEAEVSGQNAAGDVAFSNISGTSNASDLGVGLASGGGGSVNGNWVLMSASVPEPSSLVLSGIAALAGAGAWTRKTLKRR